MSESNNNTPMRITQLEEATAFPDGSYIPIAKAGWGTKKIDSGIITRPLNNIDYSLNTINVDIISFKGIGNSYVSANGKMKLLPDHTYKITVKDWDRSAIPSSSTAYLFQYGYTVDGASTSLYFITADKEISTEYTFLMPNVEDAVPFVGGRINSGEYANVIIEDVTDAITIEKLREENSFSNYLSVLGKGNSYAEKTSEMKLSPATYYRFFIDKWEHENIPSSASSTLLRLEYFYNGTFVTIKNFVTQDTLPKYIDFYVPNDAIDSVIKIGGRCNSGSLGIIRIEEAESEELKKLHNFLILSSKNSNVYTSATTEKPLKSGHFYKIKLIDWLHDLVPTTGSGILFDIRYVIDDVQTSIVTIPQTSTIFNEYLIYLNDDLVDPRLMIGGRINSDTFGLVDIVDLTDSLPPYVEGMINGLNNALVNHQTSNSISFPFITDIHINNTNLNEGGQWAMLMSKKAINEINKKNPLDLCVLNGDYLNNNNTNKETIYAWYKCLDMAFSDLKIPQWRGIGNHDLNDSNADANQHLTFEDYYQRFFKYTNINKFALNYGFINKAYGYFDDQNRKIRFIFIDTVDVPSGYSVQHTKGISNEQLNFVANALKFQNSRWGVVFISHHALQDNRALNPSESDDAYLTPEHGGIPLMGIINAYIFNTSYSYNSSVEDWNYSVNVDYSENPSNEVIGMFSGHMHMDGMVKTSDGYVMMSGTAAGTGITNAKDQDGNIIVRKFFTPTEASWDIITIDRISKTIYADRYGGGVSRSIKYGN